VLLKPAEHLALPSKLAGKNAYKWQHMRLYEQVCPEVSLCRRMAKLWYRWVETKGLEYTRGIQGTWNRIQELVITMPRIESANTNHIVALLALPPATSLGPVLNPRPLAVVSIINS